MQIKLKSKNITLTGALKDYTEKKLSRIEKYFDHILSADVMLSTQRNLHLVEVTVHVNGVTLRGEEKTDNMYSSIDKVIDKLERQVLKLKEKLHDHHHVKEDESAGEEVPVKVLKAKVNYKKQQVLSQTAADAREEMMRLGSDYYLFHNEETENINLIYRQKNGNLMVIEPVLKA